MRKILAVFLTFIILSASAAYGQELDYDMKKSGYKAVWSDDFE